MSKAKELRKRLVEAALEWEDYFGVAPSIASAISELDAARLVGMKECDYCAGGQDRTAVTKDTDFTLETSPALKEFAIKLPPIGLAERRDQPSHW